MSRCTDPLRWVFDFIHGGFDHYDDLDDESEEKIRRVVTDNKDLGFATSQEELAEMCPKLMDGLRCRHLLLFYQNYKPVSSNTEDSSLRNSQPVQTKSCSQQPSQPPNPLPPNSLKFVFLSCGTIQLKEEVLMCK